MGFDPAYRTGCKIAVIDETGKLLATTTVYPTETQNDVECAKKELIALIKKYNINHFTGKQKSNSADRSPWNNNLRGLCPLVSSGAEPVCRTHYKSV